jgi:hypothetical protein
VDYGGAQVVVASGRALSVLVRHSPDDGPIVAESASIARL